MREAKNLEFKEKVSNSFLKTVSAFSNYGTGQIKFGIDDNGNIVGVSNPRQTSLDIGNKIHDSIEPRPKFFIEIDSKTSVINLTVVKGLDKPYFYKSSAYKPSDSSTVPVDSHELKRLIMQGENRNFESLQSKAEGLTFVILENKLKSSLGIEEVTRDTLISLEFFSNEEGFNIAAELLSDVNSFHGIDQARFGENINIILDRETYEKISILELYDRAMNNYRKYYQYEVIERSLRRKKERIPEEAFREALANALVHRSWDLDAHIRIAMFDDRVEVISPGGLPRGMTKEEYLEGQISILRNPIIGNIFFRLHHIERFGSGVRRINSAYELSEVKPRFKVFENSIKVILPTLKLKIDLTKDEKLVYEAFTSSTLLSSFELMQSTGFGKNKVLSILKSLREQGYIDVVGVGRATRYKL